MLGHVQVYTKEAVYSHITGCFNTHQVVNAQLISWELAHNNSVFCTANSSKLWAHAQVSHQKNTNLPNAHMQKCHQNTVQLNTAKSIDLCGVRIWVVCNFLGGKSRALLKKVVAHKKGRFPSQKRTCAGRLPQKSIGACMQG